MNIIVPGEREKRTTITTSSNSPHNCKKIYTQKDIYVDIFIGIGHSCSLVTDWVSFWRLSITGGRTELRKCRLMGFHREKKKNTYSIENRNWLGCSSSFRFAIFFSGSSIACVCVKIEAQVDRFKT